MFFWKKQTKKTEESKSPERQPGKRRSIALEVKLMAVEAKEAGLGTKEVSEIVGVSATTVENWWGLWKEKGSEGFVHSGATPTLRKVSEQIRKRIEEKRLSNPQSGVQRISDELRRDEALSVSAETVRQVVNDAGLGNPAPESKRRPPQIRRFERELPNAMWQIDIFTFELKRMYKVYLVGMIDDHSRYIVGHGLFRQQTAEAVQAVVKGAIGQWGAPRELLSDNGRQFAAWRGTTQFQKILAREGIQHVRSAPHHPMTLGKIERFWKTLWTEFLSDQTFASFADAQQRLAYWIQYYNHQRPHQGIDGAAPADRFYGIAGDVEEAVRQGCKENALQLALGQEIRPPLFLLGKLGNTDVRVTRKGDEIELKIGESVHETIRMGAAFRMDESGNFGRGAGHDGMEGDDGTGAIPGGGDGAERRDAAEGHLRDVSSEPADAGPRNREGGGSGDGSAGAESAGSQAGNGGSAADYRALEESILSGAGSGALEEEV